MTHDGLGKYLSQIIEKAPGPTADIVGILKETKTDVVVNYLPVGSEEATKWYVEQILAAGCAMVNCIPVFIAREPYWQKRFVEAGVPIIGDDIKSQVGATIVHRVLTRLMRERGVKLERTSQLNVGGNTDFLNMLERERLESKKISKTNAVTSQLDYDMGADNVHIGPSDYVEWLDDRKWAYIRMEGRTFGDVPLNIELKLEVVDSPNCAGIVIDAVRCAKIGLDRGLAGSLEGPQQLLHEVAAGAASGRPVPPHDRGVHQRRGPGRRARSARAEQADQRGLRRGHPGKVRRRMTSPEAAGAMPRPPPRVRNVVALPCGSMVRMSAQARHPHAVPLVHAVGRQRPGARARRAAHGGAATASR